MLYNIIIMQHHAVQKKYSLGDAIIDTSTGVREACPTIFTHIDVQRCVYVHIIFDSRVGFNSYLYLHFKYAPKLLACVYINLYIQRDRRIIAWTNIDHI